MPLDQVPYHTVNGTKTLIPTILRNYERPGAQYEPNVPFLATLQILPGGGPRVQVEDVETGTVYWMLTSYLTQLLVDSVIEHGRITGEWIVYKQGQALGVKLAFANVR